MFLDSLEPLSYILSVIIYQYFFEGQFNTRRALARLRKKNPYSLCWYNFTAGASFCSFTIKFIPSLHFEHVAGKRINENVMLMDYFNSKIGSMLNTRPYKE